MACGGAIEVRLHIGEGAASREIEQHTIRRITEAAARGRQPVVSGLALAAERTDAGSRAGIDCGIVPVALDAEHKAAGLEISAECAADYAAIIVRTAGCSRKAPGPSDSIRGPFGIAPTPAAVDADIDAGPVVDWQQRGNVDRRCARRRRRKIGGPS